MGQQWRDRWTCSQEKNSPVQKGQRDSRALEVGQESEEKRDPSGKGKRGRRGLGMWVGGEPRWGGGGQGKEGQKEEFKERPGACGVGCPHQPWAWCSVWGHPMAEGLRATLLCPNPTCGSVPRPLLRPRVAVVLSTTRVAQKSLCASCLSFCHHCPISVPMSLSCVHPYTHPNVSLCPTRLHTPAALYAPCVSPPSRCPHARCPHEVTPPHITTGRQEGIEGT